MLDYVNLHSHSTYSLLDGLGTPKKIADRLVKIGMKACALTDHGSISGASKISKAFKEVGVKPILGCEYYLCDSPPSIQSKENPNKHHLVVLAKNLEGWKTLVKLVTESSRPHNFYGKPRIDLATLAKFNTGRHLVAFSGHLGSHLSNVLFDDNEQLLSDWKERAIKQANELQDIFGKGNFFIEIQLIDAEINRIQYVVVDCLRQVSLATGIPCVATADSHYPSREDAEDQRVMLCTNLGTTFSKVRSMMAAGTFHLGTFFKSNNYHIPTAAEMCAIHTDEEIKSTLLINSMCEEYSIFHKPYLPPFSCPNGMTSDEYLRQVCREGWRERIEGRIDKSRHQEYADRIKSELKIFQGCGLSDYFLILHEILNFVRDSGRLAGPGRGSSAGCLTAYLSKITSIDPIKYSLMASRFYNEGRNTKDKVSMPDIDIDVPTSFRPRVLSHLRELYGIENVAQIITFQTMKGRNALKNVLRAHEDVGFDEMNKITRNIPADSEISGELEEMKEETGESSIIQWCLENRADKFKDYCEIDANGQLTGPLATRFAQAMRLEGSKSYQSKHAAGVVVTPIPVGEIFPMVYESKEKTQIAGMEMDDLEELGGLKMDILGLRMLDKIEGAAQIAEFGEINRGQL